MTVALPTHVRISPHVLFQELDGEAVLLNAETERYYGLNGVGTRIWQLLKETGNARSVYERLGAEYDVAPDTLESDFTALIQELQQAGLVTLE